MPQKIVTIREAVTQAQADGYPIAQNTLRRWIKSGVIPVRYTGNRALIHYPTLIDYLCHTDSHSVEGEK